MVPARAAELHPPCRSEGYGVIVAGGPLKDFSLQPVLCGRAMQAINIPCVMHVSAAPLAQDENVERHLFTSATACDCWWPVEGSTEAST